MLVEAEVWTVARTDQGNAVLVRPQEGEIAVPIFIGQLEAQSILIGMGNVPMPRPLTHDLFLSLSNELNSEVVRIEITSLQDSTFYAQLIISHGGHEISIDARPSDCLAIAVRKKCPIYIDESVLDEAGIKVEAISEAAAETLAQESIEDKRKDLQKRLDTAISEEDYEEAARLRDELKRLDDQS